MGDILPLLLWSSKTPPGGLHPVLTPPTQEEHEPAGAGPQEGHKDDLREGAAFPWRLGGELGLFSLEKILYWPDFVVAFHYFEGA